MVQIQSIRHLGQHLRDGRWAWPGGYEKFFIADDGAPLCFPCINEEIKCVLDSIKNEINDGWKVVGIDCCANHDGDIFCGHCNYELSKEEI